MNIAPRLITLAPILGLCACASSGTPLIFGSTTTFGMTVNGTPDAQGFDFTLGYKDKNLAIVPVAVTTDGRVEEMHAWSKACGDKRDALSVFGQFTSKGDRSLLSDSGSEANAAKSSKGQVKLDRFFATGIAASHLANGYRKGMAETSTTDNNECSKQQANSGTTEQASGNEHTSSSPEKTGASHQIRRLIYAQSATIGIGISVQTSTSEQGPNFTLGYSGRDIAVIPTMDWHSNGNSARLTSRDQLKRDGRAAKNPSDSGEVDAYSVFGQFSATTSTQSIDFGLSRFFSTGLAARNLADGFEALIDKQFKADAAAAKAAGDKKEADTTTK